MEKWWRGAEHDLLCHFKKLQDIDYDSAVSDIFNLLVSTKFMAMIPMLGKIIQIVGVIPATYCEGERRFSAHRHLKT